jgi:hypothetical protein
MGASRGWVLSAIIFAAVGILFVLWGLGQDLGHWWPLLFVAFGIASLVRGMVRSENMVFGLLLIGWGSLGVVSLNHAELGIPKPFLFFIGASLIWIPVALFFGHGRK